MRVLITGAGGFVGQHLAEHLGASGAVDSVHGTTLSAGESVSAALDSSRRIDLKRADEVERLLRERAPDVIYHLAAQAFVPRSFR